MRSTVEPTLTGQQGRTLAIIGRGPRDAEAFDPAAIQALAEHGYIRCDRTIVSITTRGQERLYGRAQDVMR